MSTVSTAPVWWSVAVGDNDEAWELFQSERCVAHLGSGLGDLSKFRSKAEIAAAMILREPDRLNPRNGAAGNWDWVHSMSEGHYVIAKSGRDRVLGVGRITGPYRYASDTPHGYRHQRAVQWLWTGRELLPAPYQFHRKVLNHILDGGIVDFAMSLVAGTAGTARSGASNVLVVGRDYKREDIQRALGLEPTSGGNWATGYHQHNGEWFLFPNVGTAGRTGHNYGNRWTDEGLHWYGRTESRLGQPSIQSLLAAGARVHLFTREHDRDPFTYHGLASPVRTIDVVPVEIVWRPQSDGPAPDRPLAEEVSEGEYMEGAVRTVTVNAVERNGEARRASVRHHGCECAVCFMEFSDEYGPEVEGYIHVHHLKPIAAAGGERTVDPVNDLLPVCPNCHAVIHLTTPPRTIEEVKEMRRKARGG